MSMLKKMSISKWELIVSYAYLSAVTKYDIEVWGSFYQYKITFSKPKKELLLLYIRIMAFSNNRVSWKPIFKQL